MATPKKLRRLPPRKLKAKDDEFHRALGNAVVEWGAVENMLYCWFWDLSEIKNGEVARSIFYSARSFLGRFEMLQALLSAPIVARAQSAKKVEFIKRAALVAKRWSGQRNTIAHGFSAQNWNTGTVRIVSEGNIGKVFSDDMWKHLKIAKPPTSEIESVGVDELKKAQANFYELKHLLHGVLTFERPRYWLEPKRRIPPEEGLSRVVQLPNSAFSDQPRLTQEEKKLRQKASPARPRKLSTRERRDERIAAALKKGD